MKLIALITVLSFLVTSCSYTGVIYKSSNPSVLETTSAIHQVKGTAAIIADPDGQSNVELDSGVNDVILEFDFPRYVQHQVDQIFSKTLITKYSGTGQTYDYLIYPSYDLVFNNDRIIYSFQLKVADGKSGRVIYSEKTSEMDDYNKSKQAFMFFSTLLFPPVLGGAFYGLNAYSKAKSNFYSTQRVITAATEKNINLLEKALMEANFNQIGKVE